jgi:hypothetical protein
MDAAGRLLHKDYWRYTSYQTVFQPKHFAPADLDARFLQFYKKCYSMPFNVRRFVRGLSIRRPWGSFMTQLAMMINSVIVRGNLRRGILPYY